MRNNFTISGLNEKEYGKCLGFLQDIRGQEVKETEERVRNDIKRLYNLIMADDIIDFLEDIVRIDLELDYRWAKRKIKKGGI